MSFLSTDGLQDGMQERRQSVETRSMAIGGRGRRRSTIGRRMSVVNESLKERQVRNIIYVPP